MTDTSSNLGVAWEYVPKRAEPCACGGVVVANPTDWRYVTAAVRAHQASWRHKEWWAAVERAELRERVA